LVEVGFCYRGINMRFFFYLVLFITYLKVAVAQEITLSKEAKAYHKINTITKLQESSTLINNWRDYVGKSAVYYSSNPKDPRNGQPIEILKRSKDSTDFDGYSLYTVKFPDEEIQDINQYDINITEGCTIQGFCVGDYVDVYLTEDFYDVINVVSGNIIYIYFDQEENVRLAVRYNENLMAFGIWPAQIKSSKKMRCTDERICIGDTFYHNPFHPEQTDYSSEVKVLDIVPRRSISSGFGYTYKMEIIDGRGKGTVYNEWGSAILLVSTKKFRKTITGESIEMIKNVPGFGIGFKDPSGQIWSSLFPTPVWDQVSYDDFGFASYALLSRGEAGRVCSMIGGRIPSYKELKTLMRHLGAGYPSENGSFYSIDDQRTPVINGLGITHYWRGSNEPHLFTTSETSSYPIYVNLNHYVSSGGFGFDEDVEGSTGNVICIK